MENLQEGDRGTSVSQPKIRLAYLDGLRGLAALYVLFYHLEREINWRVIQTAISHLFKKKTSLALALFRTNGNTGITARALAKRSRLEC